AEDLRTRTLVLTTPRSSFRLGFLRDLLPTARLRVLHLVRNPAAAVNGLVDGWRHHGFFTCPVPAPLAIEGYSDQVPGGDRWWCFDLPPDWAAWTDRPLPEVCANQWTASHLAALAGTAVLGLDRHQLRFEDLVGPPERRARAVGDLAEWLGVDRAALAATAAADLPVVMATAHRRPGGGGPGRRRSSPRCAPARPWTWPTPSAAATPPAGAEPAARRCGGPRQRGDQGNATHA